MVNVHLFDLCEMSAFVGQAMELRILDDLIAYIKDTIPHKSFMRASNQSKTELQLYDVDFFGAHFNEVIIEVSSDMASMFCNRDTIRLQSITIKEPLSIAVNDDLYEYTKSTTFRLDNYMKEGLKL